jgi:hypothetical protein
MIAAAVSTVAATTAAFSIVTSARLPRVRRRLAARGASVMIRW